MTRKILGGLAVAGTLTLWTSLGSLAQDETPSPVETQAASIAADVTTAVNICEAAQTAAAQALEGQAVAAGKDPEAAMELADETVGQVQDFASNARDAIDSALSDFVEQIDESAEAGDQGTTLSLDQFKSLVDGIATDACHAMEQAVADAHAQIAGLENAQAPQAETPENVGETESD